MAELKGCPGPDPWTVTMTWLVIWWAWNEKDQKIREEWSRGEAGGVGVKCEGFYITCWHPPEYGKHRRLVLNNPTTQDALTSVSQLRVSGHPCAWALEEAAMVAGMEAVVPKA